MVGNAHLHGLTYLHLNFHDLDFDVTLDTLVPQQVDIVMVLSIYRNVDLGHRDRMLAYVVSLERCRAVLTRCAVTPVALPCCADTLCCHAVRTHPPPWCVGVVVRCGAGIPASFGLVHACFAQRLCNYASYRARCVDVQ